ncbi:multidrug efflux system subunit MdtA [Stieleria bergensis]|uniref:Multidrug efflux system subunit MdtA n=1 Tax=Stieleria bergensis TaxID=2528025 RepID=A0A517SNK6_9BACT|nr:multidrug efflux system subunit MdtA [Planctomycetes bacterium SV_7m_r]
MPSSLRLTIATAALLLAPQISFAQDETLPAPTITLPSADVAAGGITVERCVVKFLNKTKLPSESAGKLIKLEVEEGMAVQAGQIIAVIDARQAELTMQQKTAEEKVAKLNAENDINKRDAVETEKIARAQANSFEELYQRSAAGYWEMRKMQAEADRAKLRIELADINAKVAGAEHSITQYATQLVELEIEMRTLRADFPAYVENRYAQLGEWVQPGSPICELVQMDVVRVEGYARDLNGLIRRGMPVKVEITVGGSIEQPQIEPFDAVIDYVSLERNINGEHRFWVKIKNKPVGNDWLVKPGMQATITVLPQ